MKKSELLSNIKLNDSEMDCFKNCKPKQIMNDYIPIPIWKVSYSYTLTAKGNEIIADKYLILDEAKWDRVEDEFDLYLEREREKHPKRKLYNVEIIDFEFLGEAILELE